MERVDATDALWADEPIRSAAEDALGRAAFAKAVSRQVHTAPRTAGFVIAIHGPWGDGKTSVLHMVREAVGRLDPDAIHVRFDPWLFSTGQGLVMPFLEDLGAQLATSLGQQAARRIREALAGYADLLGRPGEAMRRFATQSVRERRDAIADLLAEHGRRIVVRIDDVDRLTPDEIRDVVRLVKLVGDFPQTVYLLAFERDRVERVLGEQLAPGSGPERVRAEGRAYLEKIVQVANDLPPVTPSRMQALVDQQLREGLARTERVIDDEARWDEMVAVAVLPHVRNLRDLRRLLNATTLPLDVLRDEVNPIDVIALTALRTFATEVHDGLVEAQQALTERDGGGDPHAELARRATSRPEVVEQTLMALFPAPVATDASPAEWRRARRVAVLENLLRYLHGAGFETPISNDLVERALAALAAPERLAELLATLPEASITPLAERLLDFRDRFPEATAGDAAAVFWQASGRRQTVWTALLIEVLLTTAPPDRSDDALRRMLAGESLTERWKALGFFDRRARDPRPLWLERARERLDDDVVAADAATLIESDERPALVEVVWRRKDVDALRALARDDRGLAAVVAARMPRGAPQQYDRRLRELRELLDAPDIVERIAAMETSRLQPDEVATIESLKRLIRADAAEPPPPA